MSELKERMLGQTMNEYGCDTKIYLKSEADKVIAEKDARIAELKKERDWLAKDRAQAYDDLEEERRWRKFPDEKPELGDVVLVKFTERAKGYYYPIDVVRWDSTYELGEIEVTHWMPLPKTLEDR